MVVVKGRRALLRLGVWLSGARLHTPAEAVPDLVDKLYSAGPSILATAAGGTLLVGGLIAWQSGEPAFAVFTVFAATCLASLIGLARAYRGGGGRSCVDQARRWERYWGSLSGAASLSVGTMASVLFLTSDDVLAHMLVTTLTLGGAAMVLRSYVRPALVALQLGGYIGLPSIALLATGEPVYQLLALGGLALARGMLQIALELHGSAVDMLSAQSALRESEEHLRYTVDLNPQIPWTCAPDGRLLSVSHRWSKLTGLSVNDALAGEWLSIVHPDDLEGYQSSFAAAARNASPHDARFRCRVADGSYRWYRGRAAPRLDAGGRVVRWYGSSEDIHEQVLAEHAVRESEALNRSIVEASPDSVKLLDLDGKLLFMSQRGLAARATESLAVIAGRSLTSLWPGNDAAVEAALAAARAGGTGRFSGARFGRDGKLGWWDVVISPVLDGDGAPLKLVAVARDMTQQKAAEEQVRWGATHDALTELPNRALFGDRLAEALAEAAEGGHVGLLHLDVDHFKDVNDTLGHDAGDALLTMLANRLRTVVRVGDTVARLGGDEFAVVLPGIGSQLDLTVIADGIQKRLREPFVHAGRVLDCRASVGASLYPLHGDTPDELLKSADLALYVAKATNRGGLVIFGPEMRAELQRRVAMVSAARRAVDEDRVVPFYQPKVELGTGKIAGFEALLRWRQGESVRTPDEIAAAFDDPEVAATIGGRMLEHVVRDMRHWLERGVEFGHVAVNAAAADFRRPGFAARVLDSLRAAGVPTSCFQLEVTESVFLGRGAECVYRALGELSREGVRIALDDFGTGYASLRHLQEAPVSILKIDRSFVAGLNQGESDAAIVRAVVRLGHSLGIDVVAEGVETEAQAKLLRRLRCKQAQGFLYSKAVSATEVPVLIACLSATARSGAVGAVAA